MIWNYFKGIDKSKTRKFDKEFKEKYIENIINIDKINMHKKDKDDIMLLSASIPQPIEILSKYFNIINYSSELEVRKWHYTWRFKNDLLWKKEFIFLENKFDLKKYNKIIFYTDNREDISLINYLLEKKKKINLYIIPYKNKEYRLNFLEDKNIKYEFIS